MLFESWINDTHNKNKSFAQDQRKARRFCAIALSILAVLLFIVDPTNQLLIYTFGGYLIMSLFLPILLLPVLYLWMWTGSIMGEIVSTVFLAVVYYLILFPVTFLVRKKAYSPGWKTKESFTSKDKLY